MKRDQARELLEEAAADLERGLRLDRDLLAFTVDALRCMARDLPHPARGGRGRPWSLDPYTAFREVYVEQRPHWEVAERHGVDEKTVSRALDVIRNDDSILGLILLARAVGQK